MDVSENTRITLRRDNRVLAVQWVYMCGVMHQAASPENFGSVCELLNKNPENFRYAQDIVYLLQKNLPEVDALITRFATNWNFTRIAAVELSVLRVAACELLYRNDVPPIVIINEAIEIGKLFSGEASKGFINGVLDRIKNTLSRSLRTASV